MGGAVVVEGKEATLITISHVAAQTALVVLLARFSLGT